MEYGSVPMEYCSAQMEYCSARMEYCSAQMEYCSAQMEYGSAQMEYGSLQPRLRDLDRPQAPFVLVIQEEGLGMEVRQDMSLTELANLLGWIRT